MKAAVVSQVDEHAQQRLGGLTELYNVADDAKTQHMLLRQAIAYATKANLANLLGPVIKVNTHTPCLLTTVHSPAYALAWTAELCCLCVAHVVASVLVLFKVCDIAWLATEYCCQHHGHQLT